MLDDGAIANMDLPAFDHRGYRDNDREVLDVTLEVIRHRDNRTIIVPDQNDLRRTIE